MLNHVVGRNLLELQAELGLRVSFKPSKVLSFLGIKVGFIVSL